MGKECELKANQETKVFRWRVYSKAIKIKLLNHLYADELAKSKVIQQVALISYMARYGKSLQIITA